MMLQSIVDVHCLWHQGLAPLFHHLPWLIILISHGANKLLYFIHFHDENFRTSFVASCCHANQRNRMASMSNGAREGAPKMITQLEPITWRSYWSMWLKLYYHQHCLMMRLCLLSIAPSGTTFMHVKCFLQAYGWQNNFVTFTLRSRSVTVGLLCIYFTGLES